MKEKEQATKESVYREYLEALAYAIVLALFVRTFVVQAFKIPSGSMIPTLQIGDHILVNKFIYGIKVPFTDVAAIPVSQRRHHRLQISAGRIERLHQAGGRPPGRQGGDSGTAGACQRPAAGRVV